MIDVAINFILIGRKLIETTDSTSQLSGQQASFWQRSLINSLSIIQQRS